MGGCKPNPGQKYGSYVVFHEGRLAIRKDRFALGYGTSNEAEFEACWTGLNDTIKGLQESGMDPKVFDLHLLTDSALVNYRIGVKNTIDSRKKVYETSKRMWTLADSCKKLASRFKSCQIDRQSRFANVAVLGH